MLHLVTFGGLALESVNEAVAPRLSAQRLAILAVLAAEGDRRVSRERLTGLFWPDADEDRARHSLRQALYTLRNEIGREVVRSDFLLSLDPSAITSDVASFRAALARGDRPAAGKLVRGPFLQGFYLPSAATFQRWAEEERARLHTLATAAISALALEASAGNDLESAIGWWRQLTEIDPLSGRFALGYLNALAARGDRAEALAFARAHTALVRRELETEPDAEIRKLEASLRSVPAPSAAAGPGATPTARAAPPPPGDPQAGTTRRQRSKRWTLRRLTPAALGVAGAIGAVLLARALLSSTSDTAQASGTAAPTLAVGVIHDDGPDSVRIGRSLTDMLSTNLASIPGLQVVANSRLLQLIPAGLDTSAAAYGEAARRAGATELLEGTLLDWSGSTLAIELRRVDLRTGLLKGAYRASATSRSRLVDSVTTLLARHLQLTDPPLPPPAATTRSATAYRLYLEGLRAFYSGDAMTAPRLMRAALEDDSSFAMAAYWDAIFTDDGQNRAAVERALRLAERAPERERRLIEVDLHIRLHAPEAREAAESLAARWPNDARVLRTLARARHMAGDWPATATALQRAIAIDSAARDSRAPCYVCEDYVALADAYFWWDSLAAASRVAQRFRRLDPTSHSAHYIAIWAAARAGDTVRTLDAIHRHTELYPGPRLPAGEIPVRIMLEMYDSVGPMLRPSLESPKRDDVASARWWITIALRNQGRLRDARELNATGRLAGFAPPLVQFREGNELNEGLTALEMGDAKAAVAAFTRNRQHGTDVSWAPGRLARNRAWAATLLGMALAAAGDTSAILGLADTVEYWGKQSLYGRDGRLHHYLRGLVHVAGGRDDAAIEELRQAVYSPTLGFTRVNLELGRALLRRGRPREAVAIAEPALRGEIDASNMYVTRTELHELLAQAYDRAGLPDKAAQHYRALVRAWANADPYLYRRREAARSWLASYDVRQTSRR